MHAVRRIGIDVKQNWIRYLMILPAVAAVVIFNYLPMAGLVMAFQQQDFAAGLFRGEWVGLKNFEFLFATQDAWIITRNTVLYNVVFIILGNILTIGLALILNEMLSKRLTKTLQTIYIMPHFLSMVVLSMVLFAFLSPNFGFVNNLLVSLGKEPVEWYHIKGPWPYLIVLVNMYSQVGYGSILYTAVISGISTEFYESAVLDGASKLQQIWYITLPQLKPILCINLIQGIGRMFRSDFGLFYTVPRDSGLLYDVTNTLDTYIYRGLTTMNNQSMTTAAGLYQSVVGLILVLIANKIIASLDEDCAMF